MNSAAVTPSEAEHGDSRRRRVLVVSYTFPPVGGAGVQRVTKFVKYLPQFGWDVTVLTTSNPSVPLIDESLVKEIPAAVEVQRAATWEPSYAVKSKITSRKSDAKPGLVGRLLGGVKAGVRSAAGLLLQPDPQILWMPDARRKGRALLRRGGIDVIYVTAPPFSALLLGASLAKRSKLPLVVDYRDEWGISNQHWENKGFGGISTAMQKRMEKYVLCNADFVTATTGASTAHLNELCRTYRSKAGAECILNGFDPEDFPPQADPPPPKAATDDYVVSSIGTLWNLTSCRPLIEAVERIHATSPQLLKRLRLRCVGRITPAETELLERAREFGAGLDLLGYVDHHQAIDFMRTSDELCVFLSDLPGAERVLSAKVFEYMAMKRPILAIAPRGELWNILAKYPLAAMFEPSDVAGLAEHLTRRLAGESVVEGNCIVPEEFNRVHQTRQLAALLERVARSAEEKRSAS